MNSYEIIRRLEAWRKGGPVARGSTLHFPIAKRDDLLLLSFVRMGGESAPWGIAYKRGRATARFRTIPEPRNRDQQAELAAWFAPILLGHLSHPGHSDDGIAGPETALSLRQMWVPNGSHADMLHLLAFAYTFSRFGESERRRLLNALGRGCGWLFREAHRPGQISVIDASAALRESYTFPAEDIRQRHTGFLLAWLLGAGDRGERFEEASRAERLSVATTLDPDFEEKELQPLNEAYNEARRAAKAADQKRLAKEIHGLLVPELQRRIDLIEKTIDALQSDPREVNRGVIELRAAYRNEHWYQYLRREVNLPDDSERPAPAPSPATDRNPEAAAARYHAHEASAERLYHALVHDDRELQAQAVAEGEAIFGTIADVWDEGPGRRTIPVWAVEDECDLPLRLRIGDRVAVAGLAGRVGQIRNIEPRAGSGRRFEIEITGWKLGREGPDGARVPAAADTSFKGTEVRLLRSSAEGIADRKSQKAWDRNVPGSWLTHHLSYHEGVPDEILDEIEP